MRFDYFGLFVQIFDSFNNKMVNIKKEIKNNLQFFDTYLSIQRQKEYSKDRYYEQRIKKTAYIFQERKFSYFIYRDLLKRIYYRSGYDWAVVKLHFRNEDYIWWSYITFKESRTLNRFIDKLEMWSCNRGCPQNIITIIELLNKHSYFNRRIRYYFTFMSWAHNIFIYYNRYYRYQKNKRLFGKKEHLSLKHGHKLHFVAYMYHRQFTAVRLDRNHLRY